MSHSQKDRLEAVRAILEKRNVEDQSSLVELLKTTYGITSNQTAVSRDLHRLGATKRVISGKLVYDLPQYDASEEILRLAILSVAHNEYLIVIDTLPGLAGFVGDYLDMLNTPEILGTIAGENVVFVTPTTVKEMDAVFKKVCALVKYKEI